jgi:archaellum component FlaD/FlaE
MSDYDPDKLPPEVMKLMKFLEGMTLQARSDQIGTQRMELATHIFDLLSERFLKSKKFDRSLVEMAVDYTDALIGELRKGVRIKSSKAR